MASKLEEMGLVAWLNATKGLHNNKGFKEFQTAADNPAVNNTDIARMFNVTRQTVYNWLELYAKIKHKEIKSK